jgi:hypothetical protein
VPPTSIARLMSCILLLHGITAHLITAAVETSHLFLYGGRITIVRDGGLPTYASGTPIAETIFGASPFLATMSGSLNVSLHDSTVESLTNKSLRIVLSLDTALALVDSVRAPGFSFSPLFLFSGSQGPTALSVFCLSSSLVFMTDAFRSWIQCMRYRVWGAHVGQRAATCCLSPSVRAS